MSDSIPVKINCFHSGVFKYDEDGKLNYVDGFMDQFEVNGDEVFEEFLKIIVLKVSVGRMWYKLPYEDISEKELLENGEKNKKRMASNGRYYGELDVFIEKPETSEDDEVDAELQNDEVNGRETARTELQNDEVDGREVDAELQNDEVDGDDEAEESEDEYQASDKSDDEEDLDINFEKDLEMFRDENNEDEIVDDDEVYPDTEQSSDDEEEQAERMANRGELDGVFSLWQTFYSGEEFKKQVIKYILQSRRNVVYDRWEKTKIGAKCSGRGCVWRIYCSVERLIQKWIVKVYVNTHTCHPTGKCKLIKSPAIAEVMLEKIRKEPEMSAPMIREEIREKYNIIISPEQAKIARRIVLDKLQAECNEHFARLRDYEIELLRTAPPYKRPPGRPKGKARIKGVRESPKKNQTKVDRKGRIGHCGLCGGEGHNSKKCPRESDESRKRRRLNMEQQSHEQAIEDVSSTAPPATQP
ncbi:hypothetical protein DY000_02047375 [Brassica cretica]|uniref:CCHC-type domain-containing protein n=1 Tax=Brassica cretica TaxID=69181 RepID=A0ABQ7EYM0_BRACR|nr:hypothetical protein DY000_02047375 [Brassica cretica]